MSIILKTEKIRKEWTDYNAHLNVSYYTHIFVDLAAEIILENFNIGETAAKNENKTTFVVEMNTTYNEEVKVGEEVELCLLYFGHDKKRILYKISMINKQNKKLIATTEVLSLYIDLVNRKVIEYEKNKVDKMDNFINKNSSNFNSDNLLFLKKLKK